ncbi:MAG: hypothetical protein NT004_02945 [Bacteroidetes bacterium]|nr:hypothetical protein [Bacteroidota bacterium]
MTKPGILLLCLLLFGPAIHAQTFYAHDGFGIAVTTGANIISNPTHNFDVVGKLSDMDVIDKSWNYMKEIDNSINSQSSADTISGKEKPKSKYEQHYVDLGVGFGLDYGGLIGIKIAYLPIPYVSVFASGGYYLFGFGWNVGATWHILPSTSRYTLRPNIKLMYGVNGGTMVASADQYNKMFYGVTPGAGLEIMFGKRKKNGIDFDLNFPIHGKDFFDQIDAMKADNNLSDVQTPLPVAFSLGYHHEF